MAINWTDLFKVAGLGASGYANNQAQSRAAGEEMARDREVLRQTGERGYADAIDAREAARQKSADSAYQRLQQYDHINAGGTHTPMVSPYSRAIEAPGENAKRLAGDEGIVNELHQRASFGDPYFPGSPGLSDSIFARQRMPGSDDPGDVYGDMTDLMHAGKGEQGAGWLGAILPWVGTLFGGGGKDDQKKADKSDAESAAIKATTGRSTKPHQNTTK